MPEIRTFIAIVLLAASLTALAGDAAAQGTPITNPLGEGATFAKLLGRIIGFANSLLAPLSTIMVLIGGLLYITAGGNQERLTSARKTLLWALVGIAIVLLSSSACIIISNVLGTATVSCGPFS